MRVRVQISFDYTIDEREMEYNELSLSAQLDIDRAHIESQLSDFLGTSAGYKIRMETGE